MIFLIIKLLLFVGVVGSFGYVASRIFLKEQRISVLAPFSILIGLGGYMFLVNATSYLVPIRETIWLVLLAFCVFVAYYLFTKKREWFNPVLDLSKKELQVLFGLALLVSIISGVVQLRALDPDDRSHLIGASTIGEGNFPVMNPMDPDARFPYHYGPDLLSAAMHNVTGVPWLQDYDIQTFFFGGATFLLAFILAFSISESFVTSIVAALFFFYAGGLLFLNIVNGFSPLYHRYVLGEPVIAQWKFIADMLWPKINHFYTYGIRSHTTAMGIPILLAVIYLYFKFVDEHSSYLKNGIITGLFLGAVALSLETSFVVLAFVLILALFWKLYERKTCTDPVMRQHHTNSIKLIAVMVGVGTIVAAFQGGIITNFLFSSGKVVSDGPTFALNGNPLTVVSEISGENVPIFSWFFLKEFGLPIVFFPLALFMFRRNRKVVFLSIVGIVAFLLPLLVVYVLTPNAMLRMFSVSTTIFAFVSAFLICSLFDTYKKDVRIKSALIAISLMIIYGGFMYQLACMVTPFSNFGKIHVPFVASLPAVSVLDSGVYEWVRTHTPHTARFFPYDPRFIIETGRMSPGNYESLFPEHKVPIYQAIKDHCDLASIRAFGEQYFILSPEGFSSDEYMTKCAKLPTALVFSEASGSDYRMIYQLKD